jgi:Ca2+-binding EF-hand superfamily protein
MDFPNEEVRDLIRTFGPNQQIDFCEFCPLIGKALAAGTLDTKSE